MKDALAAACSRLKIPDSDSAPRPSSSSIPLGRLIAIRLQFTLVAKLSSPNTFAAAWSGW